MHRFRSCRASERPLLTAEAAGVAINYGTLEEVFAASPDLVIAGTASTPTTRAFLKGAGIPLAEIPLANNFEEIRATTRAVGHAVGEEDKAETLIARMDATLSDLAATAPSRRIVVAGWGGGGEVPAKGTLFDSILTVAGGINIAATIRDRRFGALDFEQLLALRPDIIAFGDATSEQPGLRREQIQHRIAEAKSRPPDRLSDALFGLRPAASGRCRPRLAPAMLAISTRRHPDEHAGSSREPRISGYRPAGRGSDRAVSSIAACGRDR